MRRGDLRPNPLVRAQAPGAQPYSLGSPVDLQAYAMDVGQPPRIGGPLGVADVVTKLAAFTANPALGHGSSSLTA